MKKTINQLYSLPLQEQSTESLKQDINYQITNIIPYQETILTEKVSHGLLAISPNQQILSQYFYKEVEPDLITSPKFDHESLLSPERIGSLYLQIIKTKKYKNSSLYGVLESLRKLPKAEKMVIQQLLKRIKFGCSGIIDPYSDQELRSLVTDSHIYPKQKIDCRKFAIGEFHAYLLTKMPKNTYNSIKKMCFTKASRLVDYYFQDHLEGKDPKERREIIRTVFQWDSSTRRKCLNYKKKRFATVSSLNSIFQKSPVFKKDFSDFLRSNLLQKVDMEYEMKVRHSLDNLFASFNCCSPEQKESRFRDILWKIAGSQRFKFPWHPKIYVQACQHMIEVIEEGK